MRSDQRQEATIRHLAQILGSFVVCLDTSQSLQDTATFHHSPIKSTTCSYPCYVYAMWDLPKGHIGFIHPLCWLERDVEL